MRLPDDAQAVNLPPWKGRAMAWKLYAVCEENLVLQKVVTDRAPATSAETPKMLIVIGCEFLAPECWPEQLRDSAAPPCSWDPIAM